MSTKSIDEVFGKEERGHAAFGMKGSIDSGVSGIRYCTFLQEYDIVNADYIE
ncbi:hypothetical protein ACQRBN_11480 [Bariatricus sp. SGI.154]|uniref:hypothetical protein n=1 Tax=Bariatricus sp. SGI.154 TaxID=3420549 RepID=UPI003CFF1FD9